MKRQAGLLLPISSLPGAYPIGDFGPSAFSFVDWLAKAGFSLWQILPLAPPDFSGSPYSTYSSLALSRFYLSPEILVKEGFLPYSSLKRKGRYIRTDYRQAAALKNVLLEQAYLFFIKNDKPSLSEDFKTFCRDNRSWLADHALFIALKEHFRDKPWFCWPAGLKKWQATAIRLYQHKLSRLIEKEKFIQWLAFRQWFSLKKAANQKRIKIIGDLPFFVRLDSVDVWAHQENFLIDKNGQPKVISGVPPDIFSKKGQRWGNPLYRWSQMNKDHFRWWRQRIKFYARRFDVLRLDHFRGFDSLWYSSAKAKDARKGKWVKSPGRSILRAIKKSAGRTPLIAEDLGTITAKINALREEFSIPGIRVIIFGFGEKINQYHQIKSYPSPCVAYTSTHDTDTVRGWYDSSRLFLKKRNLRHLDTTDQEMVNRVIALGYASKADWFIVPAQDLLGLGKEARINTPNTLRGNWLWRLKKGSLTKRLAIRQYRLGKKTNRI